VRERLKVYWRDTRPMIDYYSARPTFRRVNGMQPPEQVCEAVVAAVASALGTQAGQLRSMAEAKLSGGGGDARAARSAVGMTWQQG